MILPPNRIIAPANQMIVTGDWIIVSGNPMIDAGDPMIGFPVRTIPAGDRMFVSGVYQILSVISEV
jgi:hypothetical protein